MQARATPAFPLHPLIHHPAPAARPAAPGASHHEALLTRHVRHFRGDMGTNSLKNSDLVIGLCFV